MGSRRRLLRLFVVGYVAVQLVVPVVERFTPGITSWGWEMFADVERQDRFTVQFADGHRRGIDEEEYVAAYRPVINWPQALPPHLCRVLPDAAVVEAEDRRGRRWEYQCQ